MSELPHDPYVRRGRLRRAVDGDTLDLVLDVGFGASLRTRVRLLGVNTPELRRGDDEHRARGREATAFVFRWCLGHDLEDELRHDHELEDWPLLVRTEKTGKYGRWLAQIWRTIDGQELGPTLLAAGHAEPYPSPN